MTEVTLVCLHYLGGSAREWWQLRSQLDPRLKLLAIDLPGFGAASGASGYSVEEMVLFVVKRIRARTARPWIVVGHSMGGKVAAILAQRAEAEEAGLEQLLAMIQVAASPPSPEPIGEVKREKMLAMFSATGAKARADAQQFVADNVGANMPSDAEQIAVNDAVNANPLAWRAWLESGSKEDWSERVGLLSTPALIITGEKDAGLGTAAQRRLTAPHLRHFVLVELSGAGHLLPLERPEHLALLINHHLQLVSQQSLDETWSDGRYRTLIASERVGRRTREALYARLGKDSNVPHSGLLNKTELNTLRAILNCVIPEKERNFDLAKRIDQLLAASTGDGWRPDLLPPDAVAYRSALLSLDREARTQYHAKDFAGMPEPDQQALLSRIVDDPKSWSTPDSEQPSALTGVQLAAWFEDLRSDAVRLYLAHPESLARIGYSGIANGGDGVAKTGFISLGLGAREAWEPVATRDSQS